MLRHVDWILQSGSSCGLQVGWVSVSQENVLPDETSCFIDRSVPEHAEPATARCEALGTASSPDIRYAKPRGKVESASTKAERRKGCVGTTNVCTSHKRHEF
jgi:hypothetical protein